MFLVLWWWWALCLMKPRSTSVQRWQRCGGMLPVGVTATPSGCATTRWKCDSDLRISTLIIRSIVSSCNVCFAKQRKKCRPIHSLPLPYIWQLHCNPAHTYLYCIDTLIEQFNSILLIGFTLMMSRVAYETWTQYVCLEVTSCNSHYC